MILIRAHFVMFSEIAELVACAPMAPATRVWFSAIFSFLFLFESTVSVVALETMLVQCYYYHIYHFSPCGNSFADK
jgi:hypothetical protein